MVFELNNDSSEFNSGIAIIYRLDSIHKQIHVARTSKDYEQWFEWLISFYMELVRFMVTEVEESINAQMKLTKEAYFNIKKAINTKQNVGYDLFGAFYELEIVLIKLEQKNGLGMKKNDSRFAMAG